MKHFHTRLICSTCALLLGALFVPRALAITAVAGTDQHVKIGAFVQLDGTHSSGDPLTGLPLQFEWEFVTKPIGSNAQLDDPRSPLPKFTTDLSGTYMVRCKVSQGKQEVSFSTVRVNTAASVTGHPVQLRAVSNDGSTASDYCLILDGQRNCATGGSTSAAYVAVLNRKSLNIIDQQTIDLSGGTTALAAYLGKWDSRSLILLFTLADSGSSIGSISDTLKRFGGTDAIAGLGSGDMLAFIGNLGLQAGQGWQTGPGALPGLSGYLLPDSSDNFTFAQFDYVTFNLTPGQPDSPAASIQIGGQPAITSNNAGSAGGFLLLVVDRALLLTSGPSSFAKTYDTASQTDISALVSDIRAQLAPDKLVFLTSYGSPTAGFNAQFANIAWAVNRLGGSYEYLANMVAGDRYSAILSNDGAAVESASRRTPQMPQGILRGALGRGHAGNWYNVVASSLTASADLGLYNIAAQPQQAWPHPANPAEQQAFTWIGHLLCGQCSDLRLAYNDANVSLPSWQTQLSNTPYPADQSANFAEADYNAVKSQIVLELIYAADAQKLQTNISTLWTDQQANFGLVSTAVSQKVKNSLKPDPKSLLDSFIGSVISSLISAAETVLSDGIVDVVKEVVELKAPSSVLQSVLSFGVQTAKDSLGNTAELTTSIDDTVADLDLRTAYTFAQHLNALGSTFNLITEDWGRLQGLGLKLNNVDDPQWNWDGAKTTGILLNDATVSLEAGLYRSLMHPNFNITEWIACEQFGNLPDKLNLGSEYIPDHPFTNWHAEGYIATPTNTCSSPEDNFDLILVSNGTSSSQKTAAAAILDHLYADVGDGGLQVPKPEVFRHFGLNRRVCYSGRSEDQCQSDLILLDATLGTPPPPVKTLSVTAICQRRISRNLFAVDLLLTNKAKTALASVVLTTVEATDVVGHRGVVEYAGPALPSPAIALAPGRQTTITILVTITESTRKFTLSELFDVKDDKGHRSAQSDLQRIDVRERH